MKSQTYIEKIVAGLLDKFHSLIITFQKKDELMDRTNRHYIRQDKKSPLKQRHDIVELEL